MTSEFRFGTWSYTVCFRANETAVTIRRINLNKIVLCCKFVFILKAVNELLAQSSMNQFKKCLISSNDNQLTSGEMLSNDRRAIGFGSTTLRLRDASIGVGAQRSGVGGQEIGGRLRGLNKKRFQITRWRRLDCVGGEWGTGKA